MNWIQYYDAFSIEKQIAHPSEATDLMLNPAVGVIYQN